MQPRLVPGRSSGPPEGETPSQLPCCPLLQIAPRHLYKSTLLLFAGMQPMQCFVKHFASCVGRVWVRVRRCRLDLQCAVLCCAVLCCAVLCRAVRRCAVLCCVVPCCAVPCCTKVCCAVIGCALPCCAVLLADMHKLTCRELSSGTTSTVGGGWPERKMTGELADDFPKHYCKRPTC